MDKELIRRTINSYKSKDKEEQKKVINELRSNVNYYYNNPMVSKTYLENNKDNAENGKIFLRWVGIFGKQN